MYAVCIDQPKCLLQALIGYHSLKFGSGISLSLIYRSIYDLETAESVPLEQFLSPRLFWLFQKQLYSPFWDPPSILHKKRSSRSKVIKHYKVFPPVVKAGLLFVTVKAHCNTQKPAAQHSQSNLTQIFTHNALCIRNCSTSSLLKRSQILTQIREWVRGRGWSLPTLGGCWGPS